MSTTPPQIPDQSQVISRSPAAHPTTMNTNSLEEEPEDYCKVCHFVVVPGTPACRISCGHVVHDGCIRRFLADSHECIVCQEYCDAVHASDVHEDFDHHASDAHEDYGDLYEEYNQFAEYPDMVENLLTYTRESDQDPNFYTN